MDSYTLAISHAPASGGAVLDAIRETRPPFSPAEVTREYAQLLKQFRIKRIFGDRYAGEWPREQFRKFDIDYLPSDRSKSKIYVDALPLINSGKCELLDIPRLKHQLIGLERRTSRSGRDSIDHGPSGHDDICNSVCGSLVLASAGKREVRSLYNSPNRNRIVVPLGTRILKDGSDLPLSQRLNPFPKMTTTRSPWRED